MSRAEPVIAIGLDAMEVTLVRSMVAEGRLPHIAGLMSRGTHGDLHTRPEGFLSMVWPTLFTGQGLGEHGWYFNKLWDPGAQLIRYVDPSWAPIEPFWHFLPDDLRVALLDVPFSTPGRRPTDVFLNGWQAHDDFGKLGVPKGLHRVLRRRYGTPAMTPEIFGPQNTGTLMRQRQGGLESSRQFGQIVTDVLREDTWDLVLAVFGGAHRAGHYLWSLEQADTSNASPEQRTLLEGALREIYEATDEALGRVLDAVPASARVIVFALHGMGPNAGWAEHFGEMVDHIHERGASRPPPRGWIYSLKRRLPWTWARQFTRRLPSSVNQALVPLWSRGMRDWSKTRFFALPLDLNGYLRVNLRGRDAQGIVERGPELDKLLDQLTEDFLSLEDLRDGSPIVAAVDRVDELVGSEAPARHMLPDLIVRWTDTSSFRSPGIRSRYGELPLDPKRHLPSGRSGNHTPSGWFVASGPGLPSKRLDDPLDAVDIVPTILEWSGIPRPEHFEGRPLDSSAPGHTGPHD